MVLHKESQKILKKISELKNERTKLLAEQAGLEMCSCGCDMPTRQSAKFAELIVRECLYIVKGEDDGSADTKSVRLAMIRMKQHFGIEE